METTTKRPISIISYTKGGRKKYKATFEMNGSVMNSIFKTQEDAVKFLYPQK
jgi:hypothetical protein